MTIFLWSGQNSAGDPLFGRKTQYASNWMICKNSLLPEPLSSAVWDRSSFSWGKNGGVLAMVHEHVKRCGLKLHFVWLFWEAYNFGKTYTLENQHGTWKSPFWKGKSSSKPFQTSIFGFHVDFQWCRYMIFFPSQVLVVLWIRRI